MALIEHRPEGVHMVRWVRADAIAVGAKELQTSFLLAPDAISNWPPASVDEITDADTQAVLRLNPALVLLGTGLVPRRPSQSLLAEFLRRGIGLEAMDNAAAGRTYNLLAAEGRRVVAAFLLPG